MQSASDKRSPKRRPLPDFWGFLFFFWLNLEVKFTVHKPWVSRGHMVDIITGRAAMSRHTNPRRRGMRVKTVKIKPKSRPRKRPVCRPAVSLVRGLRPVGSRVPAAAAGHRGGGGSGGIGALDTAALVPGGARGRGVSRIGIVPVGGPGVVTVRRDWRRGCQGVGVS